MAKYPGGVTVTGYIAPSDTLDQYATHLASFGKGGYRSVLNISERNNIDFSRREEGMVVFVIEDNKEYRLVGGIENTNWIYSPDSAYEIAISNGFIGTIQEWLESLVGAPGPEGYPGPPGIIGPAGMDGRDGKDGADGKSAYEIALTKGYIGTETDWVDSIKGLPGTRGADGKSAYEIMVENGYNGTETDWVNTMTNVVTSSDLETIVSNYLGSYLPLTGGKMTGPITSIKETRLNLTSTEIDLSLANVYVKIVSGNITFTLKNIAVAGSVNSFILELTNGGAYIVNFWANVKWAKGIKPTLTAAGTDILGFYTHDNGVTWRGIMLCQDSK